ncbi:hypothetical protein BGW42_008139 [Actinomortierella wolfii]|nr:hypothetical protein BGW42_008139 [Actinomortierella wolfii]
MSSLIRIGLLAQVLLLIIAVVSAAVTPEIMAVGVQYQEIRQVKGHWDGAEFNPDVDAYDGKKHKLMKTLGEFFGKRGTRVSEITQVMGRPDETKTKLPHLAGAKGHYLIYKWRGNHDYLWFNINSARRQVIESDWYYAYE